MAGQIGSPAGAGCDSARHFSAGRGNSRIGDEPLPLAPSPQTGRGECEDRMPDHGPIESLERRIEELTRRVDRLEKRLASQRPGGGGGAQVTCSVCGSKVSRGTNCAKCGIYVG